MLIMEKWNKIFHINWVLIMFVLFQKKLDSRGITEFIARSQKMLKKRILITQDIKWCLAFTT